MRVALVCPYDLTVPGGVQSHVVHLAAALREAGDDVALLGPGRPAPAPAGTPRHLPVGRAVPVPFNGSVAPIALGPGAAARTRRALARLGPDVIHVHEPVVPVVGVAAATSGVAPVVATVHAWGARAAVYRAARPLARRVLDHLAVAVAVSRAAAQFHANVLDVAADTFDIVPNGVDLARFRRAADTDPGRADGERRLLFVGRLERRKGLLVLLEAFEQLAASRDDVVLDVVGDGPQRSRAEAAIPAGLRGRVRFHGRVDDAELAARLVGCDLYVSPALGGESFGIVLLEAMAAGAAVLASDLPGYRTVVTDGLDGRLVPPGDPAALAAAAGELLDDPTHRARLASAGRRQAEAHDWPIVAAELRRRYARALGPAAG